MSGQYDYIWKLVVGGQGGVGKTTILHRYIHNEFIEDTKMTIGCQFHTEALERQGRKISLVMWDLGGQDRFRFIQGEYVKGASAAFVLFDMSRYMTLEASREWIAMIRENSTPNLPIVLVGTKLDLISQAEQDTINQSAQALVNELGLTAYSATSSKLGINVYETIHYMVDLLLWHSYQAEYGTSIQQA
ncbi:GTP-binding protein [Candidatus Bathyarchaeota archaeon]|nr:GTP-binding protein [Candidatus Bathyarchaeota archaeon]